MLLPALLLSGSLASATTLFASSYGGTVNTLSLTEDSGALKLESISSATECGPNPSWLALDAARGYLVCVNEGWSGPNGSISTFNVNNDGSLKHIQNTTVLPAPVGALIYGEPAGKRGLAVPHYTGHLSSYEIDATGMLTPKQNIALAVGPPGPKEGQTMPRAHQAILDPTGQYIVVPDLGSDKVHVFSYDKDTLELKQLDSLTVNPGDGPRHAAFYNPSGLSCETCSTFLYIVNELSATVLGYSITYKQRKGGLEFESVANVSATGPLQITGKNVPAEIQVSPDNRFLLVSNRNDSSFDYPNPDPSNTTQLISDSISTFTLEQDGSLEFLDNVPAYGIFPRHFTTNAIGNLVAIGLQTTNEVVVLAREISTGLISTIVDVNLKLEGQVSAVIFKE